MPATAEPSNRGSIQPICAGKPPTPREGSASGRARRRRRRGRGGTQTHGLDEVARARRLRVEDRPGREDGRLDVAGRDGRLAREARRRRRSVGVGVGGGGCVGGRRVGQVQDVLAQGELASGKQVGRSGGKVSTPIDRQRAQAGEHREERTGSWRNGVCGCGRWSARRARRSTGPAPAALRGGKCSTRICVRLLAQGIPERRSTSAFHAEATYGLARGESGDAPSMSLVKRSR